ncbi:MAG: isoprenyl transferase [Candidatus Gastranaerophilaceae bacterium]|jgi:undecaprenyl diphosphate synthase
MGTATLSLKDEVVNIVNKTKLNHIAIIMDGNRRWAKKRFLPSAAGHSEGVKALKRTVSACSDLNIGYLTVYAFSTENWGRKQEEVDFLMNLLAETIKNDLLDLHKNNVKIKIIGNISVLNNNLRNILNDVMETTSLNTGLTLQIAFNYGSRDEIKNAVKNIASDIKSGKIDVEHIDESLISEYLYTKGIPDPDLLIRTSGEQRISNYLLWQIAYSEMFVTEKFWPDFDREELGNAIINFGHRSRRFGKD